jgi:ribonuclease HI
MNLFSDLGFEKNSICVDGSYFGSGIMQFQLVETATRSVIYRSNEIIGGSNNIAEFLGLVYAIHYVFENNDPRTIYCDSYTALKWFQQKEVNTTVEDEEVLKILTKAMNFRKKFCCKYWFESIKIDPEWDAFVKENPHLRDAKGNKLERNCIVYNEFLKWETESWGEIPADFNRKR